MDSNSPLISAQRLSAALIVALLFYLQPPAAKTNIGHLHGFILLSFPAADLVCLVLLYVLVFKTAVYSLKSDARETVLCPVQVVNQL